MKQPILLLFALFAFSPLFAQNLDTPAERAAIQKVCMAETQAWLDKDMAAYAAAHLQSEQEVLIWNNDDGSYGSFSGWKAIEAAIREDIKTSKRSTDKLMLENVQFTMSGNMAFVVYDQILTASDGKVQKSREHRVLLHDAKGGWKIQAMMAFWNYKK